MTEHGGGHLPNGEGDDGGVSSSEKDKQYELLGNIQILSFTASPPQVTPFEPTTLSWNVKLRRRTYRSALLSQATRVTRPPAAPLSLRSPPPNTG